MTKTLRIALGLVVATAGLSACSDNKSTTTTPPVVTPLEDQFGTGFGTRYRAAANTKATEPAAGDLNPVSLTTKPIPL